MTLPAFERDPYLRALDVEVLEVRVGDRGPEAVLSDTVIYPGGGGQPHDRGRLGDVDVIEARKEGGRILHRLAAAVAPGPARLELDWGRRYDHMQQHTGQHVLTATALARFGWPTTAFHLGPEVSDVELDVPTIDRADLDRLEEAVAAEIRAAHPVRARRYTQAQAERIAYRSRILPDEIEGDLRLVEIEGVDLNTCGGTHVANTAEIESLKLLGTQPMRGGTRVFFVAGERVRRRLGAHEARGAALRDLLDARDEDLPAATGRLKHHAADLARGLRRANAELARLRAERLAAKADPVVALHVEDADAATLRQLAQDLQAAAPAKVALLTTGSAPGGLFLLALGDEVGLDAKAAGTEVASILEGRGGGAGRIYQGKAARLDRRDLAVTRLRELVADAGT